MLEYQKKVKSLFISPKKSLKAYRVIDIERIQTPVIHISPIRSQIPLIDSWDFHAKFHPMLNALRCAQKPAVHGAGKMSP